MLDALARDDRALLRQLLHPYLHWTEGGRTVRGRTRVLDHLAAHPAAGPPVSYELRDGQVYRWTGDQGVSVNRRWMRHPVIRLPAYRVLLLPGPPGRRKGER